MKLLKFRIINFVPRILIRYKSLSTNRQKAWKYFAIPSKPKSIIKWISELIFGDPYIYTDELGILALHDSVFTQSDIILAVGVGSGISLIHNCAKGKQGKSFIGIDGSKQQLDIARKNAKLNDINKNSYSLIHGFVGNPTGVYGKSSQVSNQFINIDNFKFDILELDCEGSEIEILSELYVKPRHIIVEMHPFFRRIILQDFLKLMYYKGYKIEAAYTVSGKEISLDNIDYYFSDSVVNKLIGTKSYWGPVLDLIIVLLFSNISSNSNV